jgi:uncharacterized protein
MPRHTGFASLPLHTGKAPPWLFGRMARLSREILAHIVADFGPHEVLRRLSDPFWFQAFGCVLGFDWHSCGVTTTVCGAVRQGLRGAEHDFGLHVAGGKGAASRKTPLHITAACEGLGLDPAPLVHASRTAAKVDSAAVQDGYQLYHHAFFLARDGAWCVVQQGMRDATSTARRYHWLSDHVRSFVEEPHEAVCCDARGEGLNLVADESAAARAAVSGLARQAPEVTLDALGARRLPLLDLPSRHALVRAADVNPAHLGKILLRTYERAPRDFESLLGVEGVGPKTLRALALAGEIIYGAAPSTRDPARFAFAHGGKDGTPFPVDRRTYDTTIEVLRRALDRAAVDRSEKVRAFRRLSAFASGARPHTAPDRAGEAQPERTQPAEA